MKNFNYKSAVFLICWCCRRIGWRR